MSKERAIGRAEKRQYDLPLNRGSGTGFLVILIALMTFLGMLALSASFALSAMTHRWSSGLENRISIEIPTQDETGKLLDRPTIRTLTQNIAEGLKGTPGIVSIHALDDAEITKLVEPWLGTDLAKTDIPIPGIVAIETSTSDSQTLQAIHNKISAITPNARMDTHEEWLSDLLRFTGAMKLVAMILAIVIAVTTVTAVSGAVRSRMALHRAEVELLHLMGASDKYITRQFQRHSMILALRGGIAGAVFGGIILVLIGWIAGQMGVAILPDFHLEPVQIAMLALTPFAASLIATISARWTVGRVLATFP
ncbi:MAG: permease family protein [Micavibrio sp.]|nr:permease family protein [Micavibrio sp.]